LLTFNRKRIDDRTTTENTAVGDAECRGVEIATPFIVETRRLVRDFNGFRAINDVNLRIRRGTIHALIGPNGAGKTTCFNLISKFLSPTSGKIFFNGTDITNCGPAEVARVGMARNFQISQTFTELSVLENVRIALQRATGTSHRFWSSLSSQHALDEQARRSLEDVGLADFANVRAGELSYGRKRVLEIATTLALDPSMLLLDEPTSGMGREDVQPVVELIQRIAKQRTLLMVEHNLPVVSALAETITVLAHGEILAEGSYSEIARNDLVTKAYMGTNND
jgi:branched-chain amino acid transport system ATP-binding protein